MRWAIDGDVILYAVCFAAKDDPVSFACRSSRSFVENVMHAVGAEACDIYLTGSGNYRMEYGCEAYPYKGTRKSDKPEHFAEVKKFMIENLGAILVEGEEADDRLGIDAVQHGSGIATIDKDLLGVPGWHYNWNQREVQEVSPEDADRFFYKQLITGDSTDNIPGLFKRVGWKATKKFIDPIDFMHTPEEMYDYVRNVYLEGFEKVGMMLDQKDEIVDDWLLRQGRQLWIRREPNELWEPPKWDVE